MPPVGLLIVSLFPLVAGIAILWSEVRNTMESRRFLARLEQVTGTVGESAGRSQGSRGSQGVALLAVRYTDARGREHRGSIAANEGYQAGDQVALLYDPAQPGFIMLPKYTVYYERGSPVFCIVGIGFILGGAAFLASALRRLLRRQERS